MTGPAADVIRRRRERRQELLAIARAFAQQLDAELGVQQVIVFGSVARGDFSDHSDVDVLVIATDLPGRALDRNARIGIPPPGVEFVAWTPAELARERQRGNPITVDVDAHGIMVG